MLGHDVCKLERLNIMRDLIPMLKFIVYDAQNVL